MLRGSASPYHAVRFDLAPWLVADFIRSSIADRVPIIAPSSDDGRRSLRRRGRVAMRDGRFCNAARPVVAASSVSLLVSPRELALDGSPPRSSVGEQIPKSLGDGIRAGQRKQTKSAHGTLRQRLRLLHEAGIGSAPVDPKPLFAATESRHSITSASASCERFPLSSSQTCGGERLSTCSETYASSPSTQLSWGVDVM